MCVCVCVCDEDSDTRKLSCCPFVSQQCVCVCVCRNSMPEPMLLYCRKVPSLKHVFFLIGLTRCSETCALWPLPCCAAYRPHWVVGRWSLLPSRSVCVCVCVCVLNAMPKTTLTGCIYRLCSLLAPGVWSVVGVVARIAWVAMWNVTVQQMGTCVTMTAATVLGAGGFHLATSRHPGGNCHCASTIPTPTNSVRHWCC